MEITITNPNPRPDLVLVKSLAEKTTCCPATNTFWITLKLPFGKKYVFFIGQGYPWVKGENNTWTRDYSLPNDKIDVYPALTVSYCGHYLIRLPTRRVFDHMIVRGPKVSVETLDSMKNNEDEECEHGLAYYIFQRNDDKGELILAVKKP